MDLTRGSLTRGVGPAFAGWAYGNIDVGVLRYSRARTVDDDKTSSNTVPGLSIDYSGNRVRVEPFY